MNANPTPPSRRLAPTSAAALLDSLVYPFRGGALAAVLALAVFRSVADWVPLMGFVLNLIGWLALYKYALEVFAVSGRGHAEPPDVLGQVDAGVQTRRAWLQVLLLIGIGAALILAPDARVFIVLVAALIIPGIVFSLTIAQNLTAAMNPLNWWVVAGQLGVGYVLLIPGWWLLLAFQIDGSAWLGSLPAALNGPVYYLILNVLVLALFRWMGLFLHARGAALGFDVQLMQRPSLSRDRERQALDRDVVAAREISDPRQRAEALRETIRRGASDAVHREYCQALREIRDSASLVDYARVRCCELIELKRGNDALPLAAEALQADPAFTLPDSTQLRVLLDQLERGNQWRTLATLAINYRQTYPKRLDSLDLGARAATVFADQLGDPERAASIIESLISDAELRASAEPYVKLRNRLKHGLRLGSG